MSALRTIYKWWAALLFVAVIAQIGLAGYGAFNSVNKAEDQKIISKHTLENGWDPHVGFGYIVFLGAIVLLLLALVARLGRRWVLASLTVALLVVLEIILAGVGGAVSSLGFLHPINALVIFAVTGLLVHRAWTAKT